MAQEIRYGQGTTIQMDVCAEALVADCTQVGTAPVVAPAEAAHAALSQPLDFPPIRRAVVPGDRVVIALEADLPQAGEIVAGLLRALVDGGLDLPQLAVLLAPDRDGAATAPQYSALRAALDPAVEVTVHDPTDQATRCYLAASRAAQPIYLNRLLCDADMVIPVGAARLESTLDYLGLPAVLYPTFSDESTRRRFRAPAAAGQADQRAQQHAEVAEVAWLLGVPLFVQVVPGPGGTVLAVLAGPPDKVAEASRRLCEDAWVHHVPHKASLVVAAIEGGHEQQTWDNLGKALFSASQVCADNGTIVLCTDLDRPPGPAVQQLARYGRDEQVRQHLHRERAPDALVASVLLTTRERQHVYLLSRLEAELVESLGFGYVPDCRTVARLAGQSTSCILLADAHRAQPAART